MKLKVSAVPAAIEVSTNFTQMGVLSGEILVALLHNKCNAVTAGLEMGDVMSRTEDRRFNLAT